MKRDHSAMDQSSEFATLRLKSDLLRGLESMNFAAMTPVQRQSVPVILVERDAIVQAQTGSGKTVAFAIGVLQRIDLDDPNVQALILCPTRELADQVCKEIRKLGKFTKNLKVVSLCGGTALGPQLASLEHGAHIVVGTPGRIEDHLARKTLYLRKIKILVLDEADRMLDMGFIDSMTEIVSKTPAARQTLLFSATFSPSVRDISQQFQKSPEEITVDPETRPNSIVQEFFRIMGVDMLPSLLALLKESAAESTLVFCETKAGCDELVSKLKQAGVFAMAVHGDLEQKDRNQVLVRFSNKSCSVLIATDVAARGLDIPHLGLIINTHVPRSADTYTHRIGRTGRAGRQGRAVTFVGDRDLRRFEALQEILGTDAELVPFHAGKGRPGKFLPPGMVTVCINAGRKNKLRPGDILGALTGPGELAAEDIGKIDIFDFYSYVAIKRGVEQLLLARMSDKQIKGRNLKMMIIDG